jgi:hypothetical protein
MKMNFNIGLNIGRLSEKLGPKSAKKGGTKADLLPPISTLPSATDLNVKNARAKAMKVMEPLLLLNGNPLKSGDVHFDRGRIADWMKQAVDQDHERSIDTKVAELSSRITAINASKDAGAITQQEALEQMASAIFEAGTVDLAKRIATTPVLSTAICELMSDLAAIKLPGGPKKLLYLFAKSINDDFHTAKEVPGASPELLRFATISNLPTGTARKVYQDFKTKERNEHAAALKNGINGLLQAMPNLDQQGRDAAMEVLARTHEFADDALKNRIAGALEKLTVDELISPYRSLPPTVTVFARERIIGNFHDLSPEQKKGFIDTIANDIDPPNNRKQLPRELPSLFKNVQQLAAALPGIRDNRLSKEVSALAAKCLVKNHSKLDSETRTACVDAARKLPISDLARMIVDARPAAKKDALIALAPIWNSALKDLKQNPLTAREVVLSFIKAQNCIYDREGGIEDKDRAAILSEYVDGFKSLGQIQGEGLSLSAPLKEVLVIALGAPLTHNYQPANHQEKGAVLRASLALLNDTDRLGYMLKDSKTGADLIPRVKRLIDDLDRDKSGISVARELNNLTGENLAALRRSIEKREGLAGERKDDALSIVKSLEERIKL